MRLIDASKIMLHRDMIHNINGCMMVRVEDVQRLITEQPTIRTKQGEWIDDSNGIYSKKGYYPWKCSECGHKISVFPSTNTHNFCPNCGAEMKGEGRQFE